MNRYPRLVVSLIVALVASAGWAQDPASGSTVSVYRSANDLFRSIAATEMTAAEASPKHLFRSLKRGAQGSQTRLYVETRDALAAMTIAYNDQPLNAQQVQDEENHLNYLMRDGAALRAKHAREKDDNDRTRRVIKAMPDAFLYEYDGTVAGTTETGRVGGMLTRLTFHPNPAYSAPTRIESFLAGMQGYVLLDTEQRRIARIDATLFKDVSFGWGFIGHLDKGGNLMINQSVLDDGSWALNHLRLKFTGKILLVKSLNVDSDEILDNFKPVSTDTTFAQGVELLKLEHTRLLAPPSPAATPSSH